MKVWRYVPCCVALTATAFLSPQSHAQSTVTLLGQVDQWIGAKELPGGDRAWGIRGGGMQTSWWGLRGQEDLGNNVKAIFSVEGFFTANDGQAGSYKGDAFFSRNAYVGVLSDYGTLTAGRHTTPYFVSTVLFNPFVDSYNFSPVVLHTFLGLQGQGLVGDSGWNNSIQYQSPNFGGVHFTAIYAFGNAAGQTGQNKWGGTLSYDVGQFSFIGAYQQVKFNFVPNDLSSVAPGFSSQQAAQAGGSYDFGFLKLTGQYQYMNDVISGGGAHSNGGQFGASVPIGAGRALASYAYTKMVGSMNTTRNTWSVGYDYNFSKRTDVYAAYLNDRITGLSSGNTFGVGIRTYF